MERRIAMVQNMDSKEWLGLNAKLQTKKNKLRKTLKEKGTLKKGATNQYDNYKYFSEMQYKELFTELFSEHGLELTSNELGYEMFDGTEKQANGRQVKFEFKLSDIDTGFYETSCITGEGIDKGDKAGYKADTGALKYYLANTFMVATGDDPEKESPENKMNNRVARATPKQIEAINRLVGNKISMLHHYGVDSIKDLTIEQASEIIKRKAGNR